MRAFLTLLLIILPASALANPAIVRSGEHDGFSRLVLYLPEDVEWSLEQGSKTATLTAENWTSGFDVGTVFFRIPRNRIAAVASRDSALEISLNCDCEVLAEELPNGPVVLDVLDEVVPTETAAEPAFRLPLVIPRTPTLERFAEQTPEPEKEDHSQALAAFRKSLIEQVGQAASQSLLEPDISDTEMAQETGSESATVEDPIETADPQPVAFDAADQIRTRSASATSQFAPPQEDASSVRRSCFATQDVAIASWGDARPFAQQLGERRRGLYGEFDSVNQDNALGLVRLYLFFGLTEEARMTARTMLQSDDEIISLTMLIADVLDDRAKPQNELVGQRHCGDMVRFWSVLADGSFVPDKSGAQSMLRIFSELSIELRRLLGPRLMARFQRANLQTEARIVQSDVARSDASSVANVVLEAGVFLDDVDDTELAAQVTANDDLSPVALAALLDRQIATNEAVDPKLIDVGFGMIREIGSGPDADALLRNLGLALARNGEIARGLATIRRLEPQGQSKRELLAQFVKESLASGELADRVSLAIDLLRSSEIDRVSEPLRSQMAQDLLRSGFPDLADEILEQAAGGHTDTRARIALAAGDEEAAPRFVSDPAVPEGIRTELALRHNAMELLLGDQALSRDARNQVTWETGNYAAYDGDDIRGTVIQHLGARDIAGTVETIAEAESVSENAQSASSDIRKLLASLKNSNESNTN